MADVEALEEILHFMAEHLVDDPEAVDVRARERGRTVVLELTVAQEDIGKVIGRGGRTARALRTVMKAAGIREDVNTLVEILG